MSWNFCVPTMTLFQSVSCNFHSCSWSVAESTLLVAMCLLPYACCHVLVAMCLLPSHDHLLWVGMSEAFLFFTTASGDSDQEWTKAGFGDWICHWRRSSSEKNNRKVCTLVDLEPWPTLMEVERAWVWGVGHSVHCWQNRTALLHLVTAFGKVVNHRNLWTATSSCQSALSLACVLELGYNFFSIECITWLSCLAFVWSWRL